MENLTIKELAVLAANETKVYVFDKPEFLQRYLKIAPNGNWSVELTLENCKEYVLKNGYKPILHPLSSLTKEITINGETFVPIEWFEIGDEENCSLEYDYGNIKLISFLKSISSNKFVQDLNYDINFLPFGVVQKLLEWKFDCFNLIERGLAISVSKNFNPYK